MGVEHAGGSYRLGRLNVDNTYIDCALIMNQYPGGCMLEVEHREQKTFCFVDELDDAVIIAFSTDLDDFRVTHSSDIDKETRFIEFEERLLLLLPAAVYHKVESDFERLLDD